MRDTAVVVPCYNESRRLDVAAFRDYARSDPHVTLLFVNDGSTDRTQDILDELNRTDPVGCRVLHLERNGGKAEAVRQGVLAALETGPAYVGYWDADLATPLGVIPEFRTLLAARPALELVLGSRVRLLGRDVRRSPRRHYLGRVFATVASHVLGLNVYDTQCGAKLFRVTPTTRQLFQEPFRSTWIFDVEILARLIRARHRSFQFATERVLCEFPLPFWEDVAGSKLKARDFLRAPLELGGIYRHYLAGLRVDAGTAGGTPAPHRARDQSRGRNSPRPTAGTIDQPGS